MFEERASVHFGSLVPLMWKVCDFKHGIQSIQNDKISNRHIYPVWVILLVIGRQNKLKLKKKEKRQL
jgi:hypothetical protein